MVRPRARPPEDITPDEFFEQWIPAAVAADDRRRRKLGTTRAAVVFEITGPERSVFTVWIEDGRVRAEPGVRADPDLRVEVDPDTWRALNRGDLGAPRALIQRRLKIRGDVALAFKLHSILR